MTRYGFKWYWLRWLCSVADLADGLAGTLTLGFWRPDIGLRASDAFLNYQEDSWRKRADAHRDAEYGPSPDGEPLRNLVREKRQDTN